MAADEPDYQKLAALATFKTVEAQDEVERLKKENEELRKRYSMLRDFSELQNDALMHLVDERVAELRRGWWRLHVFGAVLNSLACWLNVYLLVATPFTWLSSLLVLAALFSGYVAIKYIRKANNPPA